MRIAASICRRYVSWLCENSAKAIPFRRDTGHDVVVSIAMSAEDRNVCRQRTVAGGKYLWRSRGWSCPVRRERGKSIEEGRCAN